MQAEKNTFPILNSTNNLPHIIETLNELVDSLTEGERVTYSHIMNSIQIPKLAFDEINSWSQDCYTRNCIAHGDEFELILLCWEAGQVTPIHDHGGEECWVKIIDGEFRETLYQKDEAGELNSVKSVQSSIGDVTYMVDFMGFHRLENLSDKRSMTLHLYAKPIKTCNIYNEETETFVPKDMSYDTISEVIPH
jgi:cysteine dioxygenase